LKSHKLNHALNESTSPVVYSTRHRSANTLQKVSIVPARRDKPVARFHLKTRQLAFLVHLDEERCLARAAEAAGLTQPAASKLLRQVEVTLGVQLFEREPRGMSPTGYGEILIRHARAALSELGLARKEIAALRSGVLGKAAIGVVLDPSNNLLARAVAQLKERHPGVLVAIEVDSSRALVQRLAQGDLDMVMGPVLDTRRADDLLYEPLATNDLYAVIAAAAHPLAGRKALQLADVLDQPWILPPAGSVVRDKLEALFVQNGLPLPANIVETRSLPVIGSLLQTSTMVAAVPEEAARSACTAGDLTVLVKNLPLGTGTFGLITRRDHQLTPAAQLMLKTVRELAGQLHGADKADNATPHCRAEMFPA
jgi:DNA-binding transcriptional LysR family regulator